MTEALPDAEKYVDGKPQTFFSAVACAACAAGYVGRIGVREVLEVNMEIQQLIMNRASASQIKEAAMRNGMTTMVQDGFLKAMQGITTIEEVLRIIHE